MPAMSQTTSVLLWVHWIQFGAERIALAAAGLFAGAQLYRSLIAHPRLLDAAIEPALLTVGDIREDGLLAGLAGVAALAALLACVGGASVAWMIPGVADGLAAVYLMTEVRRTCDRSKETPLERSDALTIAELLQRWKRQHRWVAAAAAGAFLVLALLG
jgi:hypothetical protein